MAVNSAFHTSNLHSLATERSLYQNLIKEAIQIYGHYVYYVNRTTVALDNVLGEDALSKYTQAQPIEMYVEDGAGFGGDKEITSSNTHMDTRVAGVISNTAAYVMYSACPGIKNLVALTGRVPCKVVGKIKKGDILVTAGIHGVAMASADPKVGSIVGKAVEDYDSDHIGTITVAVGRT